MSVKSINPRAAALALSALIGGSVKPFANSYSGLYYMPIKVGSRSPITVYEAKRGDFDGDCEVIVALDTRPDAKEVVRALLDASAGVDAASNAGNTALIFASDKGHIEVVHLILSVGVNVDAANNVGDTALILASGKGHVEVARALLAADAGMDAANGQGFTALILASNYGHVEVVRALLSVGASKHFVSPNGASAYSAASHTPASTAAIRALLDLAP